MARTASQQSETVTATKSDPQIEESALEDRVFEARDILNVAIKQMDFIQYFTLVPERGGGVELQPRQVTGLSFCMGDVINRLEKVESLLNGKEDLGHE
ncbi:hypothetical protein SAMN05216428_11283 [Nitrosospira sp. Nsp11]|uniref:hypothetical protein n=1 Tax=Nitrosospira sp. Nsp11 TaxID=1855338 RepID=UPI000922DF3C|nr:hypothetical protein [Nitrosospira sp. Nsp11]SHM05266.1 hypothetical protein SAMN05216428_11283 [Nitrosospira sp. Nsp11]